MERYHFKPYSSPGSPKEQQHSSPDDESISNAGLHLNPSRMQDDEIIQVTFLSYEVKAKYTTQLAHISNTLTIFCEERLSDLVHEYLHPLP